MEIKLHKLAKTTPAIRLEIQNSQLSASELADKYHLSLPTIYKWRSRDNVLDKSHARHNLLSSISIEEEEIIKELHQKLSLSTSDITEVMNRCLKRKISASAVYRAMRRLGVAKRSQIASEAEPKRFEGVTEIGYIHMDVKYLTKLQGKRSYVYVAIDRLTRYVYVEVLYNLEPQTTQGFVERFIKNFGYPVKTILTDNGFEWTDRCAGKVKDMATGNHPVDIVCNQYNINHKLTRIRRPQTNGMVERFNRRINEAIAQKEKIYANSGRNSFNSHEERDSFIAAFVYGYNRTRLRCLQYQSPLSLLENNHPTYNTYAEMTF